VSSDVGFESPLAHRRYFRSSVGRYYRDYPTAEAVGAERFQPNGPDSASQSEMDTANAYLRVTYD
jgi:hypothetical protein